MGYKIHLPAYERGKVTHNLTKTRLRVYCPVWASELGHYKVNNDWNSMGFSALDDMGFK